MNLKYFDSGEALLNWIWGSHSGDNKEYGIVGCNAV
jgi:hypothetical protein